MPAMADSITDITDHHLSGKKEMESGGDASDRGIMPELVGRMCSVLAMALVR